MEKNQTLNSTPSAQRVHIGFFGMRNAGKSSVVNAVLGQQLAIVSDVKGTTTDPVYKAMELLPLGPVVMIDTPGIDDEGELGKLRVKKSYQVLNQCDCAVLVVDTMCGLSQEDKALLQVFQVKKVPFLIAWNKYEEASQAQQSAYQETIQQDEILRQHSIPVGAINGYQISELKEWIARLVPQNAVEVPLVSDLIEPGDFVVLVVPIDSAAPKGRLILPQQQVIRDILDAGAVSIVVKENELASVLETLGKKPKLVITDSQVFAQVAKVTPKDILLTSFSILMARYKGSLEAAVRGATALEKVQDGDTILISEGCTHHRQCDDIGTVKLPKWIREYTKKDIQFAFSSGTEFPEDLSKYPMIVHCGGCMLNGREMQSRMAHAKEEQVPITNYGILIAYMKGILHRSVQIFPDIEALLKD